MTGALAAERNCHAVGEPRARDVVDSMRSIKGEFYMRRVLSPSRGDAASRVVRSAPGTRLGVVQGRVTALNVFLPIAIGCLLLLAFASTASAAGTGKIEGTVTKAGHAAVVGATVTVYGEGEESVGTATTNSSGEYTVSGLSEGDYEVEFKAASYVTQYYNKRSSLEDATPVHVNEGAPTQNIDAEMQEPGDIAGRVTNSGGAPLEGVSVDVYANRMSFTPVKVAFSNANGEYMVTDLPEGEYRVRFTSNTSQYLTQYYNGQGSLASANPVLVTAGKTALSIDAVLVEAGKITGTVTDAYSHAGLGKIEVFAYTTNGEFNSGFAKTNSSGSYTINGLSSAPYKLEFSWEYSEAEEKACEHAPRCPPKYITQYYSGQPSAVTANAVTATAGAVTAGINVAMVPSAPFNTAGPGISGKPVVGSLLTCSSGSWTGEPELALTAGWPLVGTFSYQWLRDGSPIAGATSDAYIVQAADVGHSLVCEVTATNGAGHTSARSSALAIANPVPVVKTTASKLVVKKNTTKVSIACANAACVGSAELVAKVSLKSRKGRKSKPTTLVLAKGVYSLVAGKTGTVALRVSANGKRQIAHAKHHRMAAKLILTVSGGKKVEKAVLIGL
jgi:hypothetical protein